MLFRLTALPFFVVWFMADTGHAQSQVRPYPEPRYRRLGVYGGGPRTCFDYNLVKLNLSDTFPNKKQYWTDLKTRRQNSPDAGRNDIYLIYCGERQGTNLDLARKRVDGWLKSEAGVETFPDLIPAICLGEENTSNRNTLLNALARHIREQYGIPVFQWYTDPYPPNPDLTADGWIWDSYGWDAVRFRKHLMKFVALGKPAVCVPWATDPHWPQWTNYPTTEALINSQWQQFRICMEFDVSCAVFAVAGPGAINPWLGSQTKEMVKLRNWLRTKRAAMHAFRADELPLSSADLSARDRAVPVGGDADAPSMYEDDFSGFGWIHDADIRGFLDLKLTSRPDEPGFLLARTEPNREIRTSLVYRFESYFPLESVQVTLDASAPSDARCRNELALSVDELGDTWPRTAEQTKNEKIQAVVLRDTGVLKGKHAFYLRVSMANHASHPDLPGNRLDRLRVICVHQPPPAGIAARLVADEYENLTYEDDFSTTRWRHLGELEVGHADHGGYRKDHFWVGMVGGHATSTHLVQRFTSPRRLRELVIIADCKADGKNLGGRILLQVAPRNREATWTASTQGLHRGPLRLDVPETELKGLKEFDVHVTLQSGSGVEGGQRACASLSRLRVEAK